MVKPARHLSASSGFVRIHRIRIHRMRCSPIKRGRPALNYRMWPLQQGLAQVLTMPLLLSPLDRLMAERVVLVMPKVLMLRQEVQHQSLLRVMPSPWSR